MRQNGRQSVALRDAARDIKGMLFASDLSAHMWSCGEARLQEIERAASVPELAEIERSLVSMVASLVEAGTSPENIGRSITAVADAVARRVVELCVQELGPPPVPFVFVALGSQGRQEMTLLGDQDNAIIYADGGRDGSVDPADYFLKLGEDVCRDLDQIGYDYCTGNVMARNPKWNQPLSQWKKTFTDWIAIPVDEKLLRFNIFFDLRPIYGAEELATELRGHIHETLAQCPSFFPHFARNTLHYKPPIGLFGQIVTGGERADPESFNIKDAALPIINFVRLYTLKNGIDATHTMDRLKLLRRADVLRDDTHRELREAWRHLMRLRFQNQVHAIREGRKPNNSINPKALTQIDASIVKQAFSQIAAIQKKVGFDFLGGA
jgi:CBS domain-containing protein